MDNKFAFVSKSTKCPEGLETKSLKEEIRKLKKDGYKITMIGL